MSTQLFDLSGKNALVTGSSQGIGLALAQALCAAGAHVIINGRDATKLERARAQFSAPVSVRAFDVTDEAAVTAGIDGIERDIGPIDILVNNTGIQIRKPLEEFETAAWHTIIATNLTSVFFVSRAAVKHMIPRGRGKIINVCSVNSECARYSIAPYTATKGALKNLTRGMCVDWARHGIQVNGLGPGYFDTELTRPLVENAEFTAWLKNRTPAQRWGNVKELGGAAIFLASAAADFVNGHVLYVDGGMLASL
ncbi:MAG TPA: SDR family oxidoreductase [Burkholderiales bacterium]|nr:SDR family oxidoreductase [Burkholderiales bacterium]